MLSNTAIGIDESKWDDFADGLVHVVLGTQTADRAPSSWVLVLAPVLLIGLPLLQALTLVWVGLVRGRRPSSRIAWASAIVVTIAALVFALWVAPNQNPDLPSLEFLWEYNPDVGLSTALVVLLAAVLAGTALRRAMVRRANTLPPGGSAG